MRLTTPDLLAFVVAVAMACLTAALPASAGSLQVSTTTLEVPAPGAATSLVLRNTGTAAISAQIRILKWEQSAGAEQLTATQDVVASPPFAAIEPGRDYTVRVVRVGRQPSQQEESYRLVIDELPTTDRNTSLGVKFAVRYSIPVFFTPAVRETGALAWHAQVRRGQFVLTATNNGNKRVRLSTLNIVAPGDVAIVRQDGLVGYVLGRSTMSWTFPVASGRIQSEFASITANSDSGPINARIPLTQ